MTAHRERLVVAAGTAATILAVAMVGVIFGSDNIPLLMRDPASTANTHPLHGMMSNSGAALWLASSVVLWWTALLLRHCLPPSHLAFLMSAGALSALLCVDDFFMLHDFVLLFYLGIPEFVTLSLGAAIVAGHLFVFRASYFSARSRIFGLALVLLLYSVGIDQLEGILASRVGDWHYFIEDMPKWCGIVGWFYWHAAFCHDLVQANLEARLRN